MVATTFIGFDSAWAGNPKKPGAICALRIDSAVSTFTAPALTGFDEAFDLIRSLHRDGDLTLIAIDQPTIVPNQTGMRPAERVVAGTISWSGGGIQPAYRDKTQMFGDGAPIWRLLDKLRAIGCVDDPEWAVGATQGLFVMEVYPALALLSLDDAFVAGRGRRPCYNPANRAKFRPKDWRAVCTAAAEEGRRLGLHDVAAFCEDMSAMELPRKADQDRLDAAICLLVAKRWRDDCAGCAMIGDLASGYVVAPVGTVVRARLVKAATLLGVAIR